MTSMAQLSERFWGRHVRFCALSVVALGLVLSMWSSVTVLAGEPPAPAAMPPPSPVAPPPAGSAPGKPNPPGGGESNG